MKLTSTILFFIWTIIMGILFFTPGSPYEGNMFFEGEDKVAHFCLFFGWSFLMSIRGHYTRLNSIQLHLFIILVAISGGVLTEILQGYIPNRSKDIYDFVADMAGMIFGLFSAAFIKKFPVFLKSSLD